MAQNRSIEKLINDPQEENKRLQKLVDQQAKTIERMREAGRATVPKAGRGGRGRKTFIRVLFGDVHGEHHDPDAVAAFLADMAAVRPTEIVCVGDLLDAGGFLSAHKTLGVVAEMDVTYEQDVAAANMVLDELQTCAPKAKLTLIEGNHEHRVMRWVCDQTLGNKRNAEYLRKLVGPASVLNLKKRGVRYIERHEYYDGLSISGACRVEPHAIATHGEAFTGKYAAFRHMERLGQSVFFGHTHRLNTVYAEKLKGPVVAVNTGCLCALRPLYMLTKTTDWLHGYAIQVCSTDGFLAFTVPIIRGQSYLQPLAKHLNL